jgi:hypothetical protein
MAFDYTTIAFLMLCISVTVNLIFSFWTHLRVLRMEGFLARQCAAGGPIHAIGASLNVAPEDIKHLEVNFAASNPNMNVPDEADVEEDDRLSLPDSISDDSDDEFVNQLEQSNHGETPSATSSSSSSSSISEVELAHTESSRQVQPEVVHEEAATVELDYKKMNVASLKELCESRGISFSKKDRKEDLIGHLKHWDENQ